MKKHLFVSCLLLFSIVISTSAQDVLYSNSILPKSPESSAFGKNVSIPVSYSSGTPQISIPFYTVKSGSMEVPVSISYNASGIRVDEVATWVGLGWSLSAGGQISRVVRGDADDRASFGYMNLPNVRKVKYVDTAHCRCAGLTGQTTTIENELNVAHQLDLEPDQYSFSAMGYSGDFYYNQDSGKFILVPYQNITISGGPGSPGSFTLTLPNGVKCVFGGGSNYVEKLLSGTNTSYVDGNSQSPVAMDNTPYETSWALKEIEDPTGKKITFSYVLETDLTFGRGGEKFGPSLASSTNAMRSQSFFRQYISKPLVSSISGESCNIYFKQSTAHRTDMPDYSYGARSLDTIVITNKSDIPIKSFYFDYGYFVSASYSTTGILDIAGYAEEAKRRLYLKSIKEKNGVDSVPPYEFTYSDIELPSRLSNSQDYWGYYNGKTNGAYMMPRIPNLPFYTYDPDYNETNHNLPGYAQYINTGGADRRIDASFTEARILKRIKYPTGGSTEYYYEQNEASRSYLNIYGGMEPPDMVEKLYTFNLLSNPIPEDPPYPLYYPGIFTINEPSTKVKITTLFAAPCTTYVDASCKLTAKIRSLPDSTLLHTVNTNGFFYTQLNRGTYLVEVLVNGNPNDFPPSFTVTCQWGERTDTLSFKVGGIRVKKIISSDSVGNTISRSYRYKIGSGNESSGIIEGCPTYKVYDVNAMLQPLRRYFTSNSIEPLTADGKTVRYGFVTEFNDSTNSSFKTEYTFTSGLTSPPKFGGVLTGAPATTWHWQNNLLKRQQHFEKTASGGYRPLTDEQHFYTFKLPLTELYGLFGPAIIRYEVAKEWYLPDSTSTTSYAYYGNQQDSLKSYTKTFYNDRQLPSVNRSANSKGQLIDNKTWYPSDYNDVSGYNIATLLSKHILTIPIKQEVSVGGKVRSGNILKYSAYGQPTDGYSYENATLTDTVAHNKNTVLESNYQLKTSLRYDVNFNIKQVTNFKGGSSNSTYIWTNEVDGITGLPVNIFPVAGIVNADTSQVAYASFETSVTGYWTLVGSVTTDATTPMGVKCFSFSGSNKISRTGLSSGTTYIVSYWTKSGSYTLSGSVSSKQGKTLNGWTYYEHEVTGITTLNISGTGYIDELRLYPKGALMTSYHYKPAIGLTAQCDNNNHLTYYEYDDLGRLNLVRDEDKYILKKICYNYAGLPCNCGFGTTAAWQAVSSSCQQSGGFNNGYMVVTEKDMNPSSATYNTTRTSTVISNGCPTCNPAVCTGNDKKCINNVCYTGVKVYTAANLVHGNWFCTYHYVWAADCSSSGDYTETLGSQPALNGGPCN